MNSRNILYRKFSIEVLDQTLFVSSLSLTNSKDSLAVILLSYLGFTLGLSSAVTVASLFVVVRRRQIDTRQLPGYPWVPIIFVGMTLLFAGLAALRNPWEMLAAVLTIASAIVVYVSFGQKHHRLLQRR